MKVYLDNAATTKTDSKVVEAMQPYFTEKYGNPSSLHEQGRQAKQAIEQSRKTIADKLGALPEEIYFTSGGTESDNLAIKGIALAYPEKKHLITSKIEHPAILNTMKFMETQGYEVTYLEVNEKGLIEVETLKQALRQNTLLVSIMHANNEIGTIQPIQELAKITKENNSFFHTDAVQSFVKIPIDLTNIDLLSASSHKIYGPKGIGLLYKKTRVKLKPLIHGGGHEKGVRSSTENVPGIIGFAKAVEISFENNNQEKQKQLRDKLIKGILEIPNSWLNGDAKQRLPGNTNFGFDFIEGESLLLLLDQKGIASSTGSACSTGDLKSSHVLLALGLSPEKCHGSLRLTLGKETTEQEIDYTITAIKEVVEKLRELSPLGK